MLRVGPDGKTEIYFYHYGGSPGGNNPEQELCFSTEAFLLMAAEAYHFEQFRVFVFERAIRKRLDKDGAIRVTHRDMKRYIKDYRTGQPISLPRAAGLQ